jgi:hypothetical protein
MSIESTIDQAADENDDGDSGQGDHEIEDSPVMTEPEGPQATATVKVQAGFAVRGDVKRMVYRAANRFQPRLEVEVQEDSNPFSSLYTFTISGNPAQVEQTHQEINAALKSATKVTVKA